jgi:TonB family protein
MAAAVLAKLAPAGTAVTTVLAPIAVVGTAAAPPAPGDWALALALAWLAGAVLVAAVLVVRQCRYVRTLRRDGDVWRASGASAGPAVVGALRPRIVLPDDFETRYEPAEQVLVLAHERAHIARHDVRANALAATLSVAFWFNPLVHFAAGRFRLDQELACDARVLRGSPAGARRTYANAIFKTQLADSGLPVGCQWQSSHPLRERLRMLKTNAHSTRRRRAGAAAIAAVAGLFALAAYAGAPQGGGTAVTTDVTYRALKRPHYPQAMIDAKETGTVIVQATIATDGTVSAAMAVPDPTVAAQLQEAAVAAVKTWTFNPATRDGRPVVAAIHVPVTYALDGDPEPDVPDSFDALDAIRVTGSQ